MIDTDPAALPLRDIHLPDAPGWWPPAPGWWLIAVLVALAAVAALVLVRRRRQRRPLDQALGELARLEREAAAGAATAHVLAQLSSLLRRVALTRWPRAEVAGLAGEAWTAFLARTGGGACFESGPGRHLADGPYRPTPALAPEQLAELLAASRAWVRAQVRPGARAC